MTAPRPIFIIIACLAVLLGIFHYQQNMSNVSNMFGTPKEEIPEFFLDQSLTTQYRSDGSVDYQFNSEHLDYFKSADSAQVKMAYFIFFNKDGQTWHTRADHATMIGKNKMMQLNGNVKIWQPARNLELTTDELFFTESRQYAETDKPVTIKSSTDITHAVGMNLDLKEEKLHLLSGVKGSYHVNK